MATETTNTREKIIHLAHDLLTQRGPNGFSYKDISGPLGIRNAAVHYHFPSKKDLILALVEENAELLRKGTADFMSRGGEARPQLEGLFQFTRQRCVHGQPICIIGALAIDYDELPTDVRAANERFMQASHRWMTRVLDLGREQGEFEFDGDPASRATLILAAVQGARQMSRLRGEGVLDDIFSQVRSDLGITG